MMLSPAFLEFCNRITIIAAWSWETVLFPPQLNVEAHHYLVHRGWAVETGQQSGLLWLHSYCKSYTKEAFKLSLIMPRWPWKKNLYPHLVLGCIRVKHSSLKLQLKFLYVLTFPMTFQTEVSTTSASVSLEGICNGKFNCVASLMLQRAFWGSMAAAGSPHQE